MAPSGTALRLLALQLVHVIWWELELPTYEVSSTVAAGRRCDSVKLHEYVVGTLSEFGSKTERLLFWICVLGSIFSMSASSRPQHMTTFCRNGGFPMTPKTSPFR